jgi:hypothetical protein
MHTLGHLFQELRLNEGVSFWVEGDRLDGRPVAGITAPASRVSDFGGQIDGMTLSKDMDILSLVPLVWCDEADTAMQVLGVIPSHKICSPATRICNGGEALGWKCRGILGRTKPGFSKGIIVRNARAGMRRRNAQPVRYLSR